MTVLIANGATPRTVTIDSALATALNSGRFVGTVVPTDAHDSVSHNGYRAILADNTTSGGLWFATPTDAIGLYKTDGSPIFERVATWAAGATIGYDINQATGSATFTGLLTGNGTFSFTPAAAFATTGTLGIGRYPPNAGFDLVGTVGEVTDGALGVVERSCSAGAVSGADVRFTPVASLPWLRYFPTRDSASNDNPPSYFIDDDATPMWRIRDGELLGPVEGAIKERSVSASAASSVATAGQRTVMRGVAASATSGIATVGQTPVTTALGAYNWTSQLYGTGSTPCRVTLASVTAGSALLVWRGGKISDFATMPTTSVGTFTAIPNSEIELDDWPGYGSRMYILRNATAGTSVNIDCNVTSFDEHTVHVIEVLAGNTIISTAYSQQANAGAGSTQTTGSITIVRPSLIVVDWGGAGPVSSLPEGQHHVVTGVLNLPGGGTAAMTSLGGHTLGDNNGYVQSTRLVYLAATPGTYSAVVTHSPVQGASLSISGLTDAKVASVSVGATAGTASTFKREVHRSVSASALSSIIVNAVRFAIVERQVAAGATSGTSVSFLREVFRSVGVSATSLTSVNGRQVRSRSVATSATSGAAVAFKREVQRAVAAAAQSAIGVSGTPVRTRSVASGASSGVVVDGRQVRVRAIAASAASGVAVNGLRLGTIERACGMSAASGVVVFGERDVSGVKERSCGMGAASGAAVAFSRVVQRACAAGAASGADITGSRVVMRSVAMSAVSEMIASGAIVGSGVKERSCGMSAASGSEVRPEWRLLNAVYRRSTFGLFTPERALRALDLPITPIQRAAIRRVMLDG